MTVLGNEPYAYLTLVKYLCGIFEEFISTQQPSVFTNPKAVKKQWEELRCSE